VWIKVELLKHKANLCSQFVYIGIFIRKIIAVNNSGFPYQSAQADLLSDQGGFA